MSKVHFIQVDNNGAKLQAITQIVHEQLDNGKKILIAVPNQEAANFVDRLLWATPEDSFSPHSIANSPSNELVVIAIEPVNYNKAQVLINLNPMVSPHSGEFEAIYDLYDKTHPTKEQLSQQRRDDYKKLGI